MKKRLLLALIVISAVTVSLAAYYRSNSADSAPQFTTAAVTRGDVVQTVEATGTLEPVTTVQVGTQVSGTILSLHADFNSEVRKGQVIARLDPSLLQAQVEQAEATVTRLNADVDRQRIGLEDAQLKLTRARDLVARQLLPRTDLENAESVARQAAASLKAAQAQVTQSLGSLNQNKVNLSHTIITAPVDGIVISRNVDVGQTVAASMSAPTLFVLAKDLTQMRVSASIDESDIGRIKPGQPVTFSVDAYPNETFKGTVAQVRLQPVVAQNVVSYITIIDVPNEAMKLKLGMTATVTVEVARSDDVLRVPTAAIRFRPPQELLAGRAGGPGGAGREGARGGDGAQGARGAEGAQGLPPGARGGSGRAAGGGQGLPPGAGGGFGRGEGGFRRPGGDNSGRVWVLREGQLQSIRVTTGVSDGTATAVLQGDLTEEMQVVTGIVTAATATQPSASPFNMLGGRGGRGQGGGGRGGNPGRGRG